MKRNYYYEKSSITKNIVEFINSRVASVSVATVNEDGSPNVSVMIPKMTADEKYLIMGLGNSNTKKNLEKRKEAMFLFYKYCADKEDKFDRNVGVRLKTVLEENEALKKSYNVHHSGYLLRVEEVIPLG